MVRKWIAGAALVVTGLIGPAAVASAQTSPPVATPTTVTITETTETTVTTDTPEDNIDVSGTSEVVASRPTSAQSSSAALEVMGESSTISGSLSYTGVNFNVPLTIAIGALVVLAGAGLVFAGSRGLFRSAQRVH